MKRQSSLILWLAAVAVEFVFLASSVTAQSFYREDFGTTGDTGTTLADYGWDATHIGTADALNTAAANSAGVVPGNSFHWWFNNTQLQEPVVTVTEASVTAAGEIATPITPIPDLAIIWEQRLENMQDNSYTTVPTGIPAVVRVAVQMNGTTWYASNNTYPTTDNGVGGGLNLNYSAYTLPFSTAAANWRDLTLNTIVPMSATPQGATIGGVPAGPLTGDITGVGFVATFSQYQTLNFNFIEIAVPPVPGDTDGDGHVDLVDFETIRSHMSMSVVGRENGDLNGDGIVNLLDFGRWKTNTRFQVPEVVAPVQCLSQPPGAYSLCRLCSVGAALGCAGPDGRSMFARPCSSRRALRLPRL